MKILVTSGGTREPIDSVRFISNFSTGRTGAELAEAWAARGHQIVFLAGEGSATPTAPMVLARFSSFADLDRKLRAALADPELDAVVQLAAISDYSVRGIRAGGEPVTTPGKISSDSETLEITLARNPKLVERLRSYAANPAICVIAFKLTDRAGLLASARTPAQAARALLGVADAVIQNDMADIREGKRHFEVYESQSVRHAQSVGELAQSILEILQRHRPQKHLKKGSL